VVHRVLALLLVTRAGPIIVAVIVALISAPLSASEYRSRTTGISTRASLPLRREEERRLPRLPERSHPAARCGGPDAVSNLQWQTTRDAKGKDRWERRACGR
jgi:hypothetical protein